MNMINPAISVEALCSQASQFLDNGRPGAARPLIAAAAAMAEPNAEVQMAAARMAAAEGDIRTAIATLDRAVAAHAGHCDLHKRRSELRYRIGEWAGAAQDAAEAVCIDREDAEAKALLGSALLELGRLDNAIACLDDAVAAAPSVGRYRELLARAFERAGDADTALRVLLDGIDGGAAPVSAHNSAILLLMRRRDFVQAAAVAEDAGASGIADASTFALLGHALCGLERHDEASIAYQEAVKLNPGDAHLRHLAMSSGILGTSDRAPETFLKRAFDSLAGCVEVRSGALGYAIPQMIAAIVAGHPRVAAGQSVGPVLDLGCGTGLVAMALAERRVGPVTGVDISSGMLAEARARRLYAELREADIETDLARGHQRWPLIVAADVLPYFGELRRLLGRVRQRLEPDGWFIFSVETIQPDRDGVEAGNGKWAMQRQGRYAHTEDYIYECVAGAGLRVVRRQHCTMHQDTGAAAPVLLMTVSPVAT